MEVVATATVKAFESCWEHHPPVCIATDCFGRDPREHVDGRVRLLHVYGTDGVPGNSRFIGSVRTVGSLVGSAAPLGRIADWSEPSVSRCPVDVGGL